MLALVVFAAATCRPSVYLSVCLSWAGIVSKRRKQWRKRLS